MKRGGKNQVSRIDNIAWATQINNEVTIMQRKMYHLVHYTKLKKSFVRRKIFRGKDT